MSQATASKLRVDRGEKFTPLFDCEVPAVCIMALSKGEKPGRMAGDLKERRERRQTADLSQQMRSSLAYASGYESIKHQTRRSRPPTEFECQLLRLPVFRDFLTPSQPSLMRPHANSWSPDHVKPSSEVAWLRDSYKFKLVQNSDESKSELIQ